LPGALLRPLCPATRSAITHSATSPTNRQLTTYNQREKPTTNDLQPTTYDEGNNVLILPCQNAKINYNCFTCQAER
jgi:hypothetical protein